VRHVLNFVRQGVEPILVFVLTVILRFFDVGGFVPLWHMLISTILGCIAQQPGVHRWITGGDLSRFLYPRVAVHLLLVSTTMYLTGWGPLLAIAMLNITSRHINWSGSVAWRAGAVGSALGLLAGQAAVAAGIIQLYLPNPEVHGAAVFAILGCVSACRVLGHAVQRREQAELQSRRSEDRFRALVHDAAEVITVAGADGVFTYASPSSASVLGRDQDSLLGAELTELVHPADAPRLVNSHHAMLEAGPDASYEDEVRIRDADGTWRWFSVIQRNLLGNAAVTGIVGHLRDITEKHEAQEQIAYAADHDALTDLLNPAAFLRQVETSLYDAHANGALLFVDLDGFKQVNDTLGHHTGDLLLHTIAELLCEVTMGRDVIGRLGGDEFGILLAGVDQPEAAARVARRIITEIDREIAVGGHPVHVGCSIGIAMAAPSIGVRELLSRADGAMYVSKRRGRNGFHVAELVPDQV
jgi:diguanylate cyclase (GGDEF)-like protein/PAS domain S-box-containing protein